MDKKKLLGQWINSIPYGQFETVRPRVVTECRCTTQSCYQWKMGVVAPGALAKERIDQIALEETGRQVYGTLTAPSTPPEGELAPSQGKIPFKG